MNTLVLIPGRKSLRYAGFVAGRETCTGTVRGFRWQGPLIALEEVKAIAEATGLLDRHTRIVVHTLFGGEEFPAPTRLDGPTLARLQSMVRHSPLHVVGLLELGQVLQQVFPRLPAWLAFETSFFVDLPARERRYAGAAAMGGVDAVIFSGRYASCAAVVAAALMPRLRQTGALRAHPGDWEIFAKPVEGVLAEIAR